jgi:hypothetical protein
MGGGSMTDRWIGQMDRTAQGKLADGSDMSESKSQRKK